MTYKRVVAKRRTEKANPSRLHLSKNPKKTFGNNQRQNPSTRNLHKSRSPQKGRKSLRSCGPRRLRRLPCRHLPRWIYHLLMQIKIDPTHTLSLVWPCCLRPSHILPPRRCRKSKAKPRSRFGAARRKDDDDACSQDNRATKQGHSPVWLHRGVPYFRPSATA